MATTTLLDWILSILRDPDERAAFQTDPDDYAERHGFGDLSSADVHDALWLIADNQSASWDHGSGHVHYPPPPNYHNDEDAGHYLNHYISNNYTVIDDRDDVVDNSVHQDIDTDGGDFDQTIDNDTVIASGDGSTAVGGDVEDSDISSAGRDATTAFGEGDAVKVDFEDTDFGAGSAVNVGEGSANGNASDDDSVSISDDDTDTRSDDDTVTVQDNSVDIEDSGNTHTDVLSHNDTHVEDVHLDAL